MFIFGNKTSLEMGLKVIQYTLRHKAKQAGNFINIPGRAEPVWEDARYFEPVTINVTCDVFDQSKIDEVFGWLHGKGILIDDRHPDKYRIAHAYGKIDTEAINDEILTITVPFECSPFMYAVENPPVEITSSPSYIDVKGTYYCEPVIELFFKSGVSPQEFVFSVNGQNVTINLTEEHLQHPITLNAKSQKIYYSDTNKLILPDTTGSIPFFNCGGNNEISWSSDIIEKAIITKNERWL